MSVLVNYSIIIVILPSKVVSKKELIKFSLALFITFILWIIIMVLLYYFNRRADDNGYAKVMCVSGWDRAPA